MLITQGAFLAISIHAPCKSYNQQNKPLSYNFGVNLTLSQTKLLILQHFNPRGPISNKNKEAGVSPPQSVLSRTLSAIQYRFACKPYPHGRILFQKSEPSVSAASRRHSIESYGCAVRFIKTRDMCVGFYARRSKSFDHREELLSRRDLSEPQARHIPFDRKRGFDRESFSAPQDRTQVIRIHTPGCLSAFRAQNRQICGTRWFLLNAARFPA